MKYLAVIITLSISIGLVSIVLAGASSLGVMETDLSLSGEVYEVNRGNDGLLYVSDYSARQIWRVNPVTLQVDKYLVPINVADARPDGTGKIWFTDGDTTFAQLDPTTNQAVYWNVPEGRYLLGVAFDSSNRLWMTEYFGSLSKLYRFDPATTELCTYTLPLDGSHDASSQSFYILSNQDMLWIANRGLQRIYSLNSITEQATWWQIPDPGSRPLGMAFDHLNHLWWSDSALGRLSSLDPTTSLMTNYPLPNTAQPRMIASNVDTVWFSARESGGAGFSGLLLPLQAGVTPIPLDSQTYPASKQCQPSWGAGDNLAVSHSTPTPAWSSNGISTTIETDAWLIFQLPGGSNPYGISHAGDEIWISDNGRQKLMRLPLDQAIIIVDKVVINDSGGTAAPDDFQLTLGGEPVLDGVEVVVTPGTYTVSETLLPGYTFSGFGGDCDADGAITVTFGQTRTCTLTNDDQQAYIILDKVVINDNGGTALPDDFNLTLDGSPVQDGVPVPVIPGTYTAGETLLAGYTFMGFSGDCTTNGEVSVELGETRTCILTNDDQETSALYPLYLPLVRR